MATYGDHAEAVAAALRELLASDSAPVDPGHVDDLLAIREAVIDAVRERLGLFGMSPKERPSTYQRQEALATIIQVDDELGLLLDRVVYERPRLAPGEPTVRPSELLSPRQTDRTVELWRRTAVELMAGTFALETTDEPTWAQQHGAGWYVVRDLASAVEAVVVLDQRLMQLGLLNQHDRPTSVGTVDEHRLVAAHVGRVATWYATSDSPDVATPQLRDRSAPLVGAVELVSTPSDVIAAQRRLAAYLRPIVSTDPSYRLEPLIAAATARQLVSTQLLVTQFMLEVLPGHPTASSVVGEFATRAHALADLYPRFNRLADLRRYDADPHRRFQLIEISRAVRLYREGGKPFALSAAQVLDLANATHIVLHNFAKSTRREIRRVDSNLGIAHPIHTKRVMPVGRRSTLEIKLAELGNLPSPTTPISEFTSPLQRAALRGTLDLTPTEAKAPRPHPIAVAPRAGRAL